MEGAAEGPLAGKTVGLKDHTAVAGVPMTLGSYFLDSYIPEFDATVVTRLLDAGAIIAGKMNMEDFSFGGPGFAGVGRLRPAPQSPRPHLRHGRLLLRLGRRRRRRATWTSHSAGTRAARSGSRPRGAGAWA